MNAAALLIFLRRGLLKPGRPRQLAGQLAALRQWGYTLAGELRASAARYPDRVALVDEQTSYRYRELVARTDRLAHALRVVAGVRPGDRVAILCRNHAGMVELMVATSALGADVVLLNTGLSAAQLAPVVAEQGLRALCYDSDFTELAAVAGAETFRLPTSLLDELVESAPRQPLSPPPRNGRTIVLTSGTTGHPKGARRPVPPGVAPLLSIISRIPLHVGERMYICAPLFHTWGLAALQMSFGLSGTVVLSRRFDPAQALQRVVAQRCTALFVVPVMLARMLEVPPVRTRLRVVASSGSALPGGLATRFMDSYGDVLYNLYGSTEASWASIATPAELRAHPTTAGRPPRGTRLAILDPHGKPVRAGQAGRLFVGNSMLFEGYTSDDSPSQVRRDSLLPTGDLGHLDRRGLLYVDGRADDMIVSGGENVFPSEVENLLAALPQVREVAVVGVTDDEYGQRLAAYVVLKPGENLDADAVRGYVRHYLARFCVPRDVVFLAELPRNATGKVLIRELGAAGHGHAPDPPA